MNTEEIHGILAEQFGDAILELKSEAIDPWIVVAGDKIVEILTFLRDDERLQFDHLNDLTAVDYLEMDEKKAKKFPYEPHLEIVYHLSSFGQKHRTVIKISTTRWKDDEPGSHPRSRLSLESSVLPTGTNEKPTTCSASTSSVTPILNAFSARKTGKDTRSAKTTNSPSNITASAGSNLSFIFSTEFQFINYLKQQR